MATEALPKMEAVVSDDDSGVVNPDDENPIADESVVVSLRPSPPAADPDDPRLWTVLAHCDAADLAELTAIRRFGLRMVDDDGPAQVLSEFVGPLRLGGAVTRLEIVHGVRNVNHTDAPRRFSS
ncbi:hypothetical protein [Mycobacterium canetti]|uniref:hypothetical protein n=1 Tax=Mycobacterium canetti TaxID=78331 RepID=UPI0002A5538B|nr:hypothetical protein [Mycobacterium canetti]CCK65388.1 Protein of unknown function [Mycobacterium canettii CIPT 140070017]